MRSRFKKAHDDADADADAVADAAADADVHMHVHRRLSNRCLQPFRNTCLKNTSPAKIGSSSNCKSSRHLGQISGHLPAVKAASSTPASNLCCTLPWYDRDRVRDSPLPENALP